MMMDIFSSFDHMTTSLSKLSEVFTWLLILLPLLMSFSSFWMSNSNIMLTNFSFMTIMSHQTMRSHMNNMKSSYLLLCPLFLSIIIMNLMGMIPYLMSPTSHLIFTLSIGLPLWMSLIISSFMFQPYKATAMLLPSGAPEWLNPFLVIVETVSIMVRPLTLSFRLAANMTAGHVVLGLMGTYFSSMTHHPHSAFMILIIMSFYIMFEFAICLIQAYIFCLLITLYSDDHST